MPKCLTALPTPLAEQPDSEAAPLMSSPWQAPRDPSESGSFTVNASGSFARVPTLVPWSSPSERLSILGWDDDGRPTGVMSQQTADWIASVIRPYVWSPGPIPPPASGLCARPIAATWPDGSPATLFCSLPPGHDGLDQTHDTHGNTMPLPAEEPRPARKRPAPRRKPEQPEVA